MFTQTQLERMSKKFTTTIIRVIDSFPTLLENIDVEQAAEIVAGIIRTQLTIPTPPPDPASELQAIISRLDTVGDERTN